MLNVLVLPKGCAYITYASVTPLELSHHLEEGPYPYFRSTDVTSEMKATKRKPHHQKPSDDDLEGGNHNGGTALNVGMESQEDDDVVYSSGLTTEQCENLLRIHGKNELPEKTISNWFVIMNLLLEPMPVMIWLAVVIEAVLFKWTDMTILLGIQLANASISFYEISKAGNAVAALKVSGGIYLRPELLS